MRGYRVGDKSQTGFLSIDKDSKDIYNVVEDANNALKFPSTNVYNVQGFGTPQQWLEFFKGEEALSDWKFHLVKVNTMTNL